MIDNYLKKEYNKFNTLKYKSNCEEEWKWN